MRNLDLIRKELSDIRKERELLNKKQDALNAELKTMYETVYAVMEEANDYA